MIIEDDTTIRDTLEFSLKLAGFSVLAAKDGEIGLRTADEKNPDLILLDLMLPKIDGFTICKNLRAKNESVPILMLTALDSEKDKLKGFAAGADDYITKPFSPRELSARIKAVLRRRAPQMTEDRVEVRGLSLDPVSHRVIGNNTPLELGPTEFRLLHFMMTHPERVYSRAQLLDHVWGDHVFVEERTVDVHIRRLRLALEASGHENLIETVRGAGYRLSAQL